MPRERDEYFVIDKNGNEQTDIGRHDVLGNITHGWLDIEEPAVGTWLYHLPTRQKILFPLPNNITLDVNAQGVVQHVEIDEDDEWVENTQGLWSLAENRPVLSGCYADIHCCYPEQNLYVVTDARGHIQLRGDGDELLADYAMPKNIYRWHNPTEKDPHFILTRGKGDTERRAFNLLTGKTVGSSFQRIGKLSGGMRYMQTPEGRHLMVDADWNPLFELPHAPFIGGISADEDPTLDLKCEDGMLAVRCENFSYLLDSNGNIIIPPKKHKNIFTVGAERVIVSKGRCFALADREGRCLTDFHYRIGDRWGAYLDHDFAENRLALRKRVEKGSTKYGFLDADGNEVIPFAYDMVPIPGHFSQDYTVVGIETRG